MSLSVVTRLNPADPRHGGHISFSPDHERAIKDKHLSLVQSFAKKTVVQDDFHVRGMLLCNSARDYYYSRFSLEALDEIAEMLPGSPVMRSHNYQTEPVGTFISAKRVVMERDGTPKSDSHWVEALYYLPADEEGTRMARRIDLGIQREVSIGWRCAGADCSECGDPIWSCSHIPGDIYKKGICEYKFSGVTSVLEGSFVFRGGQKDTQTFVPDGQSSTAGVASGQECRTALIDGTADLAWDRILQAKASNGLDRFIASNHRRGMDWVASSLLQRAVGMGVLFGQPGERANTQSVSCSKDRFATRQAASRWVRDHDFRADRMKQVDSTFRFEQFPERLAEPDSFKSLRLDDGVEANTCSRKKSIKGDEDGREMTLDSLISR